MSDKVVVFNQCGFSNFGYFDKITGTYKAHSFNYGTRKSFRKSLTDQSFYVPAKRAITGQDVSESKIDDSSYDFPDGKITHALSDSMVDSRLPSLDMVERVELAKDSINYAQGLVKNDVTENIKKAQSKKARESAIDYTISQIVKGTSASDSASNSANNSSK